MQFTNVMSNLLIGVDTNILARLLLQDDMPQYKLAYELVKNANVREPIILNPVVLAELNWLLEHKMKLDVRNTRKLVWQLIDSTEFHLPETMTFNSVGQWYESVHFGFSDVIIAAINLENGCSCTMTFDRRAAKRVEGMELLA